MWKYRVNVISKFIVVVCGIFFAVMGILGQIPVMPQYAMRLILVLYIFIFASTILFITSIEKPPAKNR